MSSLTNGQNDSADKNAPENPKIRMVDPEGRSNTFTTLNPNDNRPEIDDDDETPIDGLLRDHVVVGEKEIFLPREVLLRILSRRRVLNTLQQCKSLANPTDFIDLIRPEDAQIPELDFTQPAKPVRQSYLRTFAVLVLLKEEDKIGRFISDEVSDQILPVHVHIPSGRKNVNICSYKYPNRLLACFNDLPPYKREGFVTQQSQFIVPFFDFNTTQHLPSTTRLPWCPKTEALHVPSQPSSEHYGGYASVARVKIYPECHAFGSTIQKVRSPFSDR